MLSLFVYCCILLIIMFCYSVFFFFFFKQKTAYGLRISDWSSDVCSSDLPARRAAFGGQRGGGDRRVDRPFLLSAPCPLCARDRVVSEIGRASCRERVWQYV